MASVSQSLFYDSPSPSAHRPSARSGHYRPFSTLYTDSPYVELQDKSLKRRSSLGALSFACMGMGMGIGFKDKDKDRAKAKAKMNFLSVIPDPDETPRLSPTHSSILQRPSTPSGATNLTPTLHLHPVAKKRSMATLFTVTDPSASSASASAPHSQQFPLPPLSASISKRTRFLDEDLHVINDHEQFVPKSIWAKRYNMKLHPYYHHVPYMQAYDPILLESDRYSNLLLQRLTHGSPSFHDYGKKPPATVLDLGCGPGDWVLHAASVWKTSQITGLDLVDVTLPGFQTTENAHFVLGDFVAFELPFPDRSFDYVRMANLVLCIPYEKWDYVFTQVRRILTVNGRMELIDDQILFPYGTPPKRSSPSWSRDMFDAFDEPHLDTDTLQGSGSDTPSTLNASDPSNSSCEEKPRQIATLRPIASSQPHTPIRGTSSSPLDAESPLASWHSQATASRELESIFENMLRQKYRIFPRPSDFVLNRMECVFGSDAAGKTKSYHIKLAPVDSADAGSGQGKSDGEETKSGVTSHFDGFSMKTKAWMGVDREKEQKKKEKNWKKVNQDNWTSKADTSIGSGSGSSSERSSLENFISVSSPSNPVPPSSPKEKAPSPLPLQPDQTPVPILSAKAAGRLGISYSDLASVTAALTHQQPATAPPSPRQSPGILVWPSTYIPLTPLEVEMHANKYVHTLLGCKPALAEFISQFVDEDGTKFVGDDEFHEVMWKYECFRRSRFNWPSEIPDPYDDELAAVPSTPTFSPPLSKTKSGSKSSKNSLDSSYNEVYHREELTHIRTIRVFEATKSDDRSFASLLFH